MLLLVFLLSYYLLLSLPLLISATCSSDLRFLQYRSGIPILCMCNFKTLFLTSPNLQSSVQVVSMSGK